MTVFLQLTGDIHEEVESHNKLLDGMVRSDPLDCSLHGFD